MMLPHRRRLLWPLALFASVLGLVAIRATAAEPVDGTRYPYDPACSWGRVADGRGMLVRCLSQAEAVALTGGGSVTPATLPSTAAPPAATGASPSDAGVPSPAPEQLTVSVGPLTVEEGRLPLAERKLGAPKDRYAQCVHTHGGMKAAEADAHVRFLVQSARGRAEGVEVVKSRGMSREAARCIAEVIDRRSVGTPEAPLVGATIVIKIKKAGK
jgi:hypothetical protein